MIDVFKDYSKTSTLYIVRYAADSRKSLPERFHRGQPVYVEGRETPRFPAIISAIGTEVLWVKKTTDSTKVKIYMSHLTSGKMTIKRRAA